jgi:hypothetical protein
MCALASIAYATEDLESLDGDFLTYLAELEGEGDDWTIVEPPSASPAKPTPTPPVAKSNAAKPAPTESATKQPTPPKGSER